MSPSKHSRFGYRQRWVDLVAEEMYKWNGKKVRARWGNYKPDGYNNLPTGTLSIVKKKRGSNVWKATGAFVTGSKREGLTYWDRSPHVKHRQAVLLVPPKEFKEDALQMETEEYQATIVKPSHGLASDGLPPMPRDGKPSHVSRGRTPRPSRTLLKGRARRVAADAGDGLTVGVLGHGPDWTVVA